MMLLDASRNKKSQSLIVQPFADDKKDKSSLPRNKTKMIKDIHALRLKLQRGTVLAGEDRPPSFSDHQPFNINIRTIDARTDDLRQLLDTSYRKHTEPVHQEESEAQQEMVLHITFREERSQPVKFEKAARS
jgi:hypothetical protein